MAKKVLHQVSAAAMVGDATSDHVFLIQKWLRDFGFSSEVFSPNTQKALENEVRRFNVSALASEEILIFHHTIGAPALDQIWERKIPLILIYHNITPPEFFAGTDPVLTRNLERGREQLAKIQPITKLALAASPYSEQELKELNFTETAVLPIVLDETKYQLPLDQHLQDQCQNLGALLLFVGRLSPNKKQEDLLKLLHFYRRFEADAHLVLVGGLQSKEYVSWLRQFAASLGLEDAVTITGHVTHQELVTYFKTADLFVSMSEHEGFCKPLIESMHLGLPVLAYAATAVPSTMGGAGVLFHENDYEALAEIADLLVQNQELRQRIISGQNERVKNFLEPNFSQLCANYLQNMGLL